MHCGAGRTPGLHHRAHQRGDGAAGGGPGARSGGDPACRSRRWSRRGGPDIQAKLGAALREAGNLRAAAAGALERARAGAKPTRSWPTTLASSTRRLGRAEDARAQFRSLIGREPQSAATWNNLGVLELSTGRVEAAAEAFRHAVAADPWSGDAWQGLGAALADRDRAAAIEAWRRAERLLPRDYDLLFNLAMASPWRAWGPARGLAICRSVR